MTVAELGQRMSSRELSEWVEFYELEPFGPEAEDVRSAISTAAIVNSANGIEKGVEPKQFLLSPSQPDAPQTAEDLLRKFKASNAFKPGNANGHDRKPEHSAHDGGSGHQNPDQSPA